jgi:hypothetical protein
MELHHEWHSGSRHEVVIWLDDEKCGDLFLKLQILHVLSSYAFTLNRSQIC